ncbi:MAG: HNH endonuclease [Candidatus Nanoarchaeia archaeon]|nr:HNH endonuclease [Candidatus Nanoarchaeia archaeon]
MRLVLFKKARYFLENKQVKITSESTFSISFEVSKYHVVGKYQNHQLIWLCDCRADANGDLCSHKIAAQVYLCMNCHSLQEPIKIIQNKGSGESEEIIEGLPYTFGLTHLTEKQKQVLREMVNFRCQDCHKHQDEVGTLEIHRMIRGVDGGLYIPQNCKVLCKECHDKYDY